MGNIIKRIKNKVEIEDLIFEVLVSVRTRKIKKYTSKFPKHVYVLYKNVVHKYYIEDVDVELDVYTEFYEPEIIAFVREIVDVLKYQPTPKDFLIHASKDTDRFHSPYPYVSIRYLGNNTFSYRGRPTFTSFKKAKQYQKTLCLETKKIPL